VNSLPVALLMTSVSLYNPKVLSIYLVQCFCCCCCRGFAYIEYETAQMASDAIICMNLINFRGLSIRVGKVIMSLCCTILLVIVLCNRFSLFFFVYVSIIMAI